MQAIIVELPRRAEPPWLSELVHEFTEDPYCHELMLGADDDTIVLISTWESSVAGEVELGVRGMLGEGGRVRRIELSIPEPAAGYGRPGAPA